MVKAILNDPAIEVIPQPHDSFLRGLDLFGARPDKGYSLTDCISMELARSLGISQVLTADRHFEREGFELLMKR
ncbi:MAG: hypothetical protein HUU16_06510 [Candidatus Omnitrophica bacterium]|nr:hypothetical protein [Candidatus Omnitrophota bacterium]